MDRDQQPLPLGEALPSIAQARIDREAAQQAARVSHRRSAESRAAGIYRALAETAGVDAVAAHAGYDRSLLYAMARGRRPPQLAPLLAAIQFDRRFGAEVLGALAAEIGCVVVPRGHGVPAAPRGIAEIVAELLDLVEAAGGTDAVEAARRERRARAEVAIAR